MAAPGAVLVGKTVEDHVGRILERLGLEPMSAHRGVVIRGCCSASNADSSIRRLHVRWLAPAKSLSVIESRARRGAGSPNLRGSDCGSAAAIRGPGWPVMCVRPAAVTNN